MKRTIIIISILTFLIPNISIGQAEKKYSKNYIPKNLTECLIQLDSTLSDSIKQNILTYSETEFVGLSQLNLGMYLRNKWGLWWGSELSVYFNNLGINHPDDMSGIILTSYCRHLNGIPIDFIELVNSSRKNNSLEPIITINEDSLTNLSILYRPFDKFSHQIICELGSRQTDYEKFNELIKDNNFPTLSSPNFYAEIGYIGNYRKLFWSLKGTVYAAQKENKNEYEIAGNNLGIEGGLGYAIMRKRYIGLISYLDYGIASFKYTLSNNSFDFENIQNINEIKLDQYSQYISPGIGFYYNMVPFYNKIIGLRVNYNIGIGNSIYNDKLKSLNKNGNIKIQGLEIMLSIIVGFD
ncbi:MAG: hypothetical protein IPN08_03475 [Bacteroidales bacterium]|nr:hypothetical protein [Bacteroidales bacterium]